MNSGKYFVLSILAIVFSVEIVFSLSWHLQFDTSLMHYIAYLVNEHGYVPYRDIFDLNMPGSYLLHMTVGKVFGYSDLAFRIADISWLAATLIVTWLIMKPIGWITALSSCLLFGLVYLGAGPYMSFQRDFLAILPIAAAVLITTRRKLNWGNLTHFIIGILFALATLIKPHLVIGFPILIFYSFYETSDSSKPAKRQIRTYILGSIFALSGFLLIILITLLWLWKVEAIQPFWEIFSSFVPLYKQMDRYHGFNNNLSLAYAKQLLISYLELGGHKVLLMGSMFGVYHLCTESASKSKQKLSILLLVLTILYSLYVAVGGRFLPYHWMPYIYFSCLCIGLIFFPPLSNINIHASKVLFPLMIFVFVCIVSARPSDTIFYQILNGYPPSLKNGRVDEIATYLEDHLLPTDRVQPLDWDGGAVQAMLVAKALPATPYIYDFQFYHHISTPYIQKIRNKFLAELKQEMPTFIIDVDAKTRVSGIDTTDSFPKLEIFLKEYYSKTYTGNGFDILKRSQ